jgi:hypothetical protein
MRLHGACAAILALLTMAGCAVTPPPAPSAAMCRFTPHSTPGDGLGGTGIASDVLLRLVGATDRGIGGTGAPQNTEERGLGGTGIVAQDGERGLGGTGIIGVVTGFASICVNGYDVAVTDATAVTVEGLPALPGDIKLGQVVEVEAFVADGTYAAATVNVRVAVAGPVSSIASDKSSLIVAGQTINVAGFGDSAPTAPLAAGQWVVVSGLRRADDVIAGTSIIALPQTGREVMVAGPIRIEADGQQKIGALALENTGFDDGENVVVRGTTSADTLIARTADVETAPAFTSRVNELSVQAYPTDLDSAQVRVGTVTVTREDLTTAMRGDVTVRVVQIDGRFNTDRVFITDRLRLPEAPVDGRIILRERTSPTSSTRGTSNAPVEGRATQERPPVFVQPTRERPERPVRPGLPERPDIPQRPETPRRN